MVTVYPSSQEDLNAYLRAIRLASSARNTMNAQKVQNASVKAGKAATNATLDHHLPNALLPPSAPADSATPVGRGPVPLLNQTSSAQFPSNLTKSATSEGRGPVSVLNQTSPAQFASNLTKSVLVHSPNKYPSINNSMDTGTWPFCKLDIQVVAANVPTLAEAPTGATLDALQLHQGHFPPPEPPSGQLHSGDAISRNILAIRSTPMCEVPTGFSQRASCGHFVEWIILGFFVVFFIMGLAWMKVRTYNTQRVDEEDKNGNGNGNENEDENENENEDEIEIESRNQYGDEDMDLDEYAEWMGLSQVSSR